MKIKMRTNLSLIRTQECQINVQREVFEILVLQSISQMALFDFANRLLQRDSYFSGVHISVNMILMGHILDIHRLFSQLLQDTAVRCYIGFPLKARAKMQSRTTFEFAVTVSLFSMKCHGLWTLKIQCQNLHAFSFQTKKNMQNCTIAHCSYLGLNFRRYSEEIVINTNYLTQLSSMSATWQQQFDGRDLSLTSYIFQKLFLIIQSCLLKLY